MPRVDAEDPHGAIAGRAEALEDLDRRGLADGNLSRHLTTLEDAGYIKIDKKFEGRKPRTWISATRAGRNALGTEIAALREIVTAADQGTAPQRAPRPATT